MRISNRLALLAVDVKHKRHLSRTSDPLRVNFEINPEWTSKIWAHVNLLSECCAFGICLIERTLTKDEPSGQTCTAWRGRGLTLRDSMRKRLTRRVIVCRCFPGYE
jgi:hypothetical protein